MTADLAHIRVLDAMHQGIVSCSSEASLGEVASLMAKHRVHAVAVTNGGGTHALGVISDLDVVGAIASGEEPTAGQTCATEPVSVSAHERLQRAAQMMTEHAVSHLVARDAANGHPIGVLSTLDLASVYADRHTQ